MLDHVTIGVSNLEQSKTFYDEVLKSSGIERLHAEGNSFAGYGANKKAFFWIGLKASGVIGVHIAFAVYTRAAGDHFMHRDCLLAAEITAPRAYDRTTTDQRSPADVPSPFTVSVVYITTDAMPSGRHGRGRR